MLWYSSHFILTFFNSTFSIWLHHKSQVVHRIIRNDPLGTIQISSEFHGNLSQSIEQISNVTSPLPLVGKRHYWTPITLVYIIWIAEPMNLSQCYYFHYFSENELKRHTTESWEKSSEYCCLAVAESSFLFCFWWVTLSSSLVSLPSPAPQDLTPILSHLLFHCQINMPP